MGSGDNFKGSELNSVLNSYFFIFNGFFLKLILKDVNSNLSSINKKRIRDNF